LEILHRQRPEDVATNKLLERAKGYEAAFNAKSQGGGFWDFLKAGQSRPPISEEELAAWTGVEKLTDK
jgi:hypothetical protein